MKFVGAMPVRKETLKFSFKIRHNYFALVVDNSKITIYENLKHGINDSHTIYNI